MAPAGGAAGIFQLHFSYISVTTSSEPRSGWWGRRYAKTDMYKRINNKRTRVSYASVTCRLRAYPSTHPAHAAEPLSPSRPPSLSPSPSVCFSLPLPLWTYTHHRFVPRREPPSLIIALSPALCFPRRAARRRRARLQQRRRRTQVPCGRHARDAREHA